VNLSSVSTDRPLAKQFVVRRKFQESLGVATDRIHRRYARRKVEAGAA